MWVLRSSLLAPLWNAIILNGLEAELSLLSTFLPLANITLVFSKLALPTLF
jgi:hypothetical protein